MESPKFVKSITKTLRPMFKNKTALSLKVSAVE